MGRYLTLAAACCGLLTCGTGIASGEMQPLEAIHAGHVAHQAALHSAPSRGKGGWPDYHESMIACVLGLSQADARALNRRSARTIVDYCDDLIRPVIGGPQPY